MKLKFASFAALSLTATQAAKLNKEMAPASSHLVQLDSSSAQDSGSKPQSYTNIMESVKSLEKAFEYHRAEEKLLGDINKELKDYWNLQEQMSHKEKQATHEQQPSQQLVNTKAKEAAAQKAQAKVEQKQAQAAEIEAKKAQSQDVLGDRNEENLQIEDTNFLQVDEELDSMPAALSLQTVKDSDPEFFNRELNQLKNSQKMMDKMQQHQKQSINQKLAQKMTFKSQESPDNQWERQLASFKSSVQQRVDQKHRNEHKTRRHSLKNNLAMQAKEVINDAEEEIKGKINLAMEAANQAEKLVMEAENDAKELLSELGADQEEPEDDSNIQQPMPSAYKFMEIPSYAYTSDLDQGLSQIYMQETSGQQANSEWDFDWGKAINQGKEAMDHLVPKAQRIINEIRK